MEVRAMSEHAGQERGSHQEASDYQPPVDGSAMEREPPFFAFFETE